MDGDGDGTTRPLGPRGRDLRGRQLPPRVGRAATTTTGAIFAYNHAGWYVAEVEQWAARYRASPSPGGAILSTEASGGADSALQAQTATPVRFIAGDVRELAPGDGHLALVPAGVPGDGAGDGRGRQRAAELAYGPGGHPDPRGVTGRGLLEHGQLRPVPLRGAADRAKSSGTTRSPRTTSTGACPGAGRWVTIYATDSPTPHVFIVIAGVAPGHQPQRHRHRPQPRRRRPALADPRPHPHMGALVGAPPTRAVRCGAWRAQGRLPADRRRPGVGELRALAARGRGAEGEILLVGREPDPPYNRPDCSKGYLRGEETREEPLFRPQEWWGEQDIELLTRTSVTGSTCSRARRSFRTRRRSSFDKALIATGANVRRLNVSGCELEQIHYLRTLGNADAIREGVAEPSTWC